MGNKHKTAHSKKAVHVETGNTQSNTITPFESNYFPKGGYIVSAQRLESIARVLLMGVYDDDNPLSVFRGMRYIIKNIWQLAIQFNQQHYALSINVKQNVLLSNNYDYNNSDDHTAITKVNLHEHCDGPYINLEKAIFPQVLQEEININMMPIKMDKDTLRDQLPSNVQGYFGLLEACCDASESLHDTICFLTIHESFVEKGRTQRRPGLHVELPGKKVAGDSDLWWAWGGGYELNDGIYVASNIGDTCAAWNCLIDETIVGPLGDIEHLRSLLPKHKRHTLEAGQLYWITDKTPHEALPMKEAAWRQFFRLVSGKLSVWYEQHSTKNPMGVLPDKKMTKIIKGNKFRKSKK